MKIWTKTTTRTAWPPAILPQHIHLPTMPSTCGTRMTWSSLCPTMKVPRPARYCWLPFPTSPLSSHTHTAQPVTALWLSLAAQGQPGRPASHRSSDFNKDYDHKQPWRLVTKVLKHPSTCKTHADMTLICQTNTIHKNKYLRYVAVCRNPVSCSTPLLGDKQ